MAVDGLTAATTPYTTVFGGFCSVTATDSPMKPEAMVADDADEAREHGAVKPRGKDTKGDPQIGGLW